MSYAEEKAIAQKYIGNFPLLIVIWGLAGPAIWLALWPLVIYGYLPIWLGGIIATIILCYSFYPTHEAEHGNIGRPDTRWHWLNELVGHFSVFPILLPYRLHCVIHMDHHKYTNVEKKDPDINVRADTVWKAIRNAWLHRQPNQEGHLNFYKLKKSDILDKTKNKDQILLEAYVLVRAAWIMMLILAWSGFALELLMLWWIPRQIAWIFIPVVSAWIPHYPMLETGRYRNTRGWKSNFGIIITAGLEYHLIHHLFPSIPLHKHPAAYRELKPILEAKGMTLNNL
jgi:beta-carotene hydroxylase